MRYLKKKIFHLQIMFSISNDCFDITLFVSNIICIVSNRFSCFQYNFLHITGASVPKNYFKENITVFRYPEMTILLVLKHARTFFISIINIRRLHFMKRNLSACLILLKIIILKLRFFIQNTKLKFYFGLAIDYRP